MTEIASKIEKPHVRHKSHVPTSMSVFTVVLSAMAAAPSANTFTDVLSQPLQLVRPTITGNKYFFADCLVTDMEADFETKTSFRRRLDYLKSTLKMNWNGENDYPIEEESYLNTKAAINSLPGRMLKYWNLFPDPNGTLLLSPKDDSIAGISIGNTEFSYAAYVSDDCQLTGKEPFSVDAFNGVIKQIHRLLGYA